MAGYIPKSTTALTVFPKVNQRDFDLAISIIREKWTRFYPKILYEPIASAPSLVADAVDAAGNAVMIQDSGAGQTVLDDLWGEDIPAEYASGWVQPHSETDSVVANADVDHTMKFQGQFWVNAHFQHNPAEQVLQKLGIDEAKDGVLIIPTIILDEVKDANNHPYPVRVQIGDRFTWQNTRYRVTEFKYVGYWKWSDIYLYVAMTCKLWRSGS